MFNLIKTNIVLLLISVAVGILVGVFFRHPSQKSPSCPTTLPATTTERVVTRTEYRDGKPSAKITEKVRQKEEPVFSPTIEEKRPYIIGAQATRLNGGKLKAGPIIGKEILPHTFVTGSVQVNMKGKSPDVAVGVLINF